MSASNANENTAVFVSCRRATELLSKRHDAPLTRRERIALRLHLLICGWCRRYGQQIALVRASLLRDTATLDTRGPRLSAEARERILRALVD